VNDAFGAVLVGVLNGLVGYDQYGSYNGDGLAQRMKARMGDDWNLSHEVLRFALIAAGADDKTSNALLQNPRWLNMTSNVGIPILATGTGTSIVPQGYDSVFAGPGFQGDSVSRLEILDSIGGTISSTPSTSELEWAIVRLR
jgi:hypothetical protein